MTKKIQIKYNLKRVSDPVYASIQKDLSLTSQQKKLDHVNSREALSNIVKSFTNQKVEFKNLNLINYHHLKDFSNYTFSIAHTSDLAISIGSLCENVSGLGVDIEEKNRFIKEYSKKFFLNDSDKTSMETLSLWCVKEACFKALNNSGIKTKFLKDVVIKDDRFSHMTKNSNTFNRFVLVPHINYCIAIAYCGKEKITVELSKV